MTCRTCGRCTACGPRATSGCVAAPRKKLGVENLYRSTRNDLQGAAAGAANSTRSPVAADPTCATRSTRAASAADAARSEAEESTRLAAPAATTSGTTRPAAATATARTTATGCTATAAGQHILLIEIRSAVTTDTIGAGTPCPADGTRGVLASAARGTVEKYG
jgi:hypothetical protein